MPKTILRKKGQFTLPSEIRKTIGIGENDVLTVTTWNDKVIIVIPQKLESLEILKKTSELAKKRGLTLEEILGELEDVRRNA